MTVEPYTCGVGDRFGQQGRAQLEAILLARQEGHQRLSRLEQIESGTRIDRVRAGGRPG
jgi:hypothetical protein